MIEIKMLKLVGSFAENKDIARDIRLNTIIPALQKNKEIILNFDGIEAVTQSFIHALISDLIRKHGSRVLDSISFKKCNESVKKIISIVIDYMQESD
ncbi:STAS-like domain-containing protein [Candidatus Woesearchaeota archaeon]|nr:STAS-like domain-containing protein [Candidatus Woesearchaeota archaeon]